MSIKYQSYYESLKDFLDSYSGDYNEVIDYSPALCKLLCDILNEKVLKAEQRLRICAALGYFVAPLDLIPEETYGPDGYIDDIYVCCYVLKELADEFNYDFLEELWDEDEELQYVIERSYNTSSDVLGDKKSFLIRYIGL